jgi:hypothetical protein
MPEGPNAPFNAKAALAELAQGQVNRAVRKLSFPEQCAAFAALYNRVDTRYVAKAFGISVTAASQIGGCLATDPRPYAIELAANDEGVIVEKLVRHRDINRNRTPNRIQRYQRVAEEFRMLGEEAFADQYYTDEIHTRIADAKYGVDLESARRERQGSDPTADDGPDNTTLPDGALKQVALYPEEKGQWAAGWYVVGTTDERLPHGREMIEGGELRPFKTKQKALQGAWLMNGYKPPKYFSSNQSL